MYTLKYQPGVEISPLLFTASNGLDFSSPDGCLIHNVLDLGTKGFRIVSVNSSGHRARFVEKDRTSISLPKRGFGTVNVDGRIQTVRPGEAIVLGPSER
ncbi:hypothetical protein AB0T83_18620 [Fluviibacterium sp. DFM31]|uniref:Uncharacterized protein n=1 Tax=Meridianimarinicoccus marinus TaxID=3231483 RepID=A0ABV3LB45_9RHOB